MPRKERSTLIMQYLNTINKISNFDLSNILFFAFRYALGRKSTAPSMMCDYLKKYAEVFTERDILQMIHEIDEANRIGNIGMEVDKKEWLELKDFLQQINKMEKS